MTTTNGINNGFLAPLGAIAGILKPRRRDLLQPDRPDEVTISKMTPEERAQAVAAAQAARVEAPPNLKPAPIQANIQRVNRQEERTDSQAPNGDEPQPVSTSGGTGTDTD